MQLSERSDKGNLGTINTLSFHSDPKLRKVLVHLAFVHPFMVNKQNGFFNSHNEWRSFSCLTPTVMIYKEDKERNCSGSRVKNASCLQKSSKS